MGTEVPFGTFTEYDIDELNRLVPGVRAYGCFKKTVPLQVKFAFHELFRSYILEAEAEFLTDRLHSMVLNKHTASEALEVFIAPELDQLSQHLGSHSLALELVCNEQGDLSALRAVGFDELTHAKNLLLPGLRILVGGDEGHLPVVVNETHADQLFVGDSLTQTQCVQPTEIDTAS